MRRFPFAPGVIDAGELTFEEALRRRHRAELVRLLKATAWWLGVCVLSGLAAGLIAGWWP